GDRANVIEEVVEHPLGVGVDPPLGLLALGLDPVDAALELRGAVVDLAHRLFKPLLRLADAALDVGAAIGAQLLQLTADPLDPASPAIEFAEHLLDPVADPVDFILEPLAGKPGRLGRIIHRPDARGRGGRNPGAQASSTKRW